MWLKRLLNIIFYNFSLFKGSPIRFFQFRTPHYSYNSSFLHTSGSGIYILNLQTPQIILFHLLHHHFRVWTKKIILPDPINTFFTSPRSFFGVWMKKSILPDPSNMDLGKKRDHHYGNGPFPNHIILFHQKNLLPLLLHIC